MLESFVFFAMCKDGFPSPSFKKRKKKREKISIMQLCAFCIALVLVFLYVNDDVLGHVIREKKEKKKRASCKCQFVVSYMIAFWTRPSVNCAVWTHLLKKKREVGGVSRKGTFSFSCSTSFSFLFFLHF
jgi:hypothetical protein